MLLEYANHPEPPREPQYDFLEALPIFGNITPIELDVDQFQLSNHAGHSELESYVRACGPRHVVFFHGDAEARQAIGAEFTQEPKPSFPLNGTPLELK